ncbi:major facilitator superfamily transporter [Polyplosphaeria fusca]|uniref:Major facilitator superfamily transporter n=1 Tax=Polyplosphaeria fusca TaxID=682080 RepID=A0A9P4QKX0_9PLEO|nr:major facilitator superfamily transporter [Polyplosphaeria fusca]
MRTPEEEPLLEALPDADKPTDVILGFDPNGDPENPREWPAAYKWAIVSLLACTAFTVTFTCISLVPLAGIIVQELDGTSNPSASALLVTIWELGEAGGPLLIAPLSEVLGRYPVVNACNLLFILATLLAALSQSTNALIGMRALTGLAVATNVLSPAIIGDMFDSDQRGSAMSLIMLAPLIGGAVGPAIGGAIAQTLGWRWVLFIACALAVACEILFLSCFKETYSLAILRRRVKKLQSQGHEPRKNSHRDLKKLWESITRPASVLFGSGVLMTMCAWASVSFSYFYVMSITLAEILQHNYNFTPAASGSAFMAFSIGSFVGVFICNATLDRIYIRLRGDDKTMGKPEYRLPLAIVGAFTLPITVIAYGWIVQLHLPVPLLLLAVATLGLTLLLSYIPVAAYVVDACGLFSASAMTGVIVIRCIVATLLPLTTSPLVERMGYGWGFTFYGTLSLCLAPIPIFLLRYGDKWRQRSEYTRDA